MANTCSRDKSVGNNMTEEMKNLDYSDIITLLIAIYLQY